MTLVRTQPRLSTRVIARLAATAAVLATVIGFFAAEPAAAAPKPPTPKVTASIEGTTLVVNGTSVNDTITLRLREGDPSKLQIFTGDIANRGKKPPSAAFEFPVSSFSAIAVYGNDGDDSITLDETYGAIVGSVIDGGEGNDTLTGGSGADAITGGAGNDTIYGKGGADNIDGGNENDTLVGGDADDQVFGGPGNDRMVWNPGDDSDLNEGGDGTDTVEVNGGNGDEQFTTTANGTRVRFDRLSPAPFFLDIGTSESLVLNANGGNDSHSATGNLAALIQITVDGGAGDDTILGSNGIDLLIGGDGDDFVDGQQGNDHVFLGAGDDVFQWDPGDGSDVVEGQAGTDTMLFNGSAGAEIFDVAANGSRVRFTRNLGNIVMDLAGVERLDLNALGNTDIVTVNPLAGTDLGDVRVNLAGTIGGSAGDGLADQVIVKGTSANDTFQGSWSASGDPVISGTGANVTVSNGEPALDSFVADGSTGNDKLVVSSAYGGTMPISFEGGSDTDTAEVNGENGDEQFTTTANGTRVRFDRLSPAPFALDLGSSESLVLNANGGNDSHSATGNLAALIQITVDGGAGNDTILGSNGSDILIGGDGNDFIDGQQGNDYVFLGAGDDVFQWDPGDGSDVVEGQAGTDTMLFNGSAGAEIFDVAANGSRVRFTRNLGNIVMDLDDVERLDLNALGNTDIVTVNPLAGTDLADVRVNLAGTIGGSAGDGLADQVIVKGTDGVDAITVSGNSSQVNVTGLAATVAITGHDTFDALVIDTLGGADTVTTAGLAAGTIQLTVN